MDTYYQLLEKDTAKISSIWKGFHILWLIVAIISGFMTAYAVGKAVDAFGDNCILFSEIEFHDENTTERSYKLLPLPYNLTEINNADTKWGTDTQCYFCQFTPVVSMIFGIFWLAMFIICAKGGAGYITDEVYRPWRIVYPAMAFAATSTIFLLISTLQLSSGTNEFCAQFEHVFGIKKCGPQIDLYTRSFHQYQRRLFIPLQIAIICSYTCFASWVAQLVTLVFRVFCVVDFQMIRITVINKEIEEQILQVISSEDSKLVVPSKAILTTASTVPSHLAMKKEVHWQDPSPLRDLNKNDKDERVNKAPTADAESYTDEVPTTSKQNGTTTGNVSEVQTNLLEQNQTNPDSPSRLPDLSMFSRFFSRPRRYN